MFIAVTETDIQNALSSNPSTSINCPVSRAIRRATNSLEVSTCSFMSEIRYKDGIKVKVPLPYAASQFVRSFDSKRVVMPFSFRIIVV